MGFGVVGREAQLAELARALDADTFHVVELLGEPGMGKTALLTELRTAALARPARVAAGKATEFERLPFAMFSDAFGDAWTDLLTSVDPRRPGRAVPVGAVAAARHGAGARRRALGRRGQCRADRARAAAPTGGARGAGDGVSAAPAAGSAGHRLLRAGPGAVVAAHRGRAAHAAGSRRDVRGIRAGGTPGRAVPGQRRQPVLPGCPAAAGSR
ncbi:ATP-binding protein [Kutzneria kofuensis]|uniref:ATP-binding protein n=1 Tax=Kutzneria kofuensis TaxID=103725 RepID=UPI003CD05FD2